MWSGISDAMQAEPREQIADNIKRMQPLLENICIIPIIKFWIFDLFV
jgi:hypothetical protein